MERTKKIVTVTVSILFLVSVFAVLFFSPVTTLAQASEWQVANPFKMGEGQSLQQIIAQIINIAFMAAGLVAVIYLIIGGFRYVTSGGNAEAIEGAKATILNAIIGLIIIFISFLLVNYILGAMGVGGIFQPEPTNVDRNV